MESGQNLWIWTSLAVLLTWMTFYISKKRKMKTAESGDDVAPEEQRRSENGATHDVIIVGAGVAGSALAYALAKDGRRVHVVERDLREPDKIQGEVMQPGGHLMLIQLGLQDCLEEIDAQKMNGLTLYKNGENTGNMLFPLKEKKFPLDASGRSFHHGHFIQRLRKKAASLPNVLLEEGTVTSLIEERGVIKGVKYKSKTGEESMALAPLSVVCDGSYSNLRRFVSNPKVEVQSYVVGFISKNCLLPEHEDSVHLIMAKPTAAMLYQISSTEVRCMVDVLANGAPSIARGDMSAYLDEVVAPQIPPKLRDIFRKGLKEGKIKVVPSMRMATSQCDKKGVIAIGDAFNMRHPILASGMMVALSDVVILRDLLRPLGSLDDASKVSQVLKSYYSLRKPMAATVNTLANALHELLIATDEAKEAMREACFDYLRRGGIYTSGMMALIGGLNPQPLSLMHHLSAITLSAIARLLFPFPPLHGFLISLRVLLLASSILGPYLQTEGVMQMFSPTTGVAYRRCHPSC